MHIGYELTLLSVYGVLVAAMVSLHLFTMVQQLGLKYALGPRDKRERLSGLAARVDRATENCVTAMVLFAPAILAIQVQGQNSAYTMLAAQAFVISRFVYVPSYLFGVRYLRTIAFLVGFAATIYLYLAAL